MLLKDKVAIITGAASARGLGFATAKLFAENGAKVVIIDLNGEASKAAATALGEGHLGLAANVADEVQVQAAMEQILAKYGRVDVLVNNAGITQPLKLMDIKRANYDAVLDVSLRGTLLMSQAVIPAMRAQKIGQHCLYLVGFSPARRRYLRRPALQCGKGRSAWPGASDGPRAGSGQRPRQLHYPGADPDRYHRR
ncbi:putative short-chain dehydrogenase/reductase SDR [Klebsiella oxytoca]|nr:putative short-chain dehydrogenase/reductase SDR [Klebsiella oxytoca]